MHDVMDLAAVHKRERSKHQRERFMWHEKLIADPELTASALRLAGLALHDYRTGRSGYTHISIRGAAGKLQMAKSTAQAARDLLLSRRWLIRLDGTGHRTSCYALGPGPGVPVHRSVVYRHVGTLSNRYLTGNSESERSERFRSGEEERIIYPRQLQKRANTT